MIHIGELYLERTPEQTRLCADISMGDRGTTLWFGVAPEQESYLCTVRSDAFVLALLPTAMRRGLDLCCETPMSERLHYQLEHYLVPTLADAGTVYRRVCIHAPLTDTPVENMHAVGTRFSGIEDIQSAVTAHGKDSEFPLTHLLLFSPTILGETPLPDRSGKPCSNIQTFAEQIGLELVVLVSNISEILSEQPAHVCSFRVFAGIFALQNLLSIFFFPLTCNIASFSLDACRCEAYDLLTIHCTQTETLSVYPTGSAQTEMML